MIVKKITAEGIAHHSYFVGSKGSAAVIDPRRDVDVYLDLALAQNMRITHIFDTHKHEDFVMGSLELAERTGAAILHGARFGWEYGTGVRDGDSFSIGTLRLDVLETPGHTDESISVVLRETAVSDEPLMVFSGDALFAGDAGRTDFYGEKAREEKSGLLYHSIADKILPLGDGVIICPAHGAGSVCGAGIADLDATTIGYEKKTSPLLRMTEREFIDYKVREHHYYPPYFRKMEVVNRQGPPLLGTLPHLAALSADEVAAMQADGAQVIDIRSPTSFAGGHIPGSIHIPRTHLAVVSGWLMNFEEPVIIVDDYPEHPGEVVRILARLGFDNPRGYLAGGFLSWVKAGGPLGTVEIWDAATLASKLSDRSLFVLDVRDLDTWEQKGHIEGATHIYLGELPGRIDEIPRDARVLVTCDIGNKGSSAASLLKRAGYPRVANLIGGMIVWIEAGNPVVKGEPIPAR
jgi:hydroxyacylglutathione hydrolase